MDRMLLSICIMCLTTIGLIQLLKKFKQPYLIAYILAGIILGPYAFSLFRDTKEIETVGEIGILLLMFFLGMEINVPDSKSVLVKPVIAQSIKIILSGGLAWIIGTMLDFPGKSITIIAIFFIFNSTTVVSEWLKSNNILHTAFGITILNILIFQDILLAPVLTLLKVWNGEKPDIFSLLLAIIVCAVFSLLLKRVRRKRELSFPKILSSLEVDHEMQVFYGLFICLGFGLAAEKIGLSSALGSFVAGVYIGRVKALGWLEHSLKPFKIFFAALFFVSVGLRLDLSYLSNNYTSIIAGTLMVLLSNSLISAIVFRLLRYDWRRSLYGGALLSQTGEFGILALSIAYKASIIPYDLFKIGLCITALSLLLSTIWIAALQKIVGEVDLDQLY